MVLSFALQVAAILLAPPNDNPLWDPLEYATLARNLYEHGHYGVNRCDFPNFPNWPGENPSRMRQPLYPLYLVVFYWLPGQNLRLLQISQVFLNLGTLCCVFAVAKRIFRGRLWTGAPVALGLYFPLWFTSALMLSESLFIFLLALAMLLFARSFDSEKRAAWFVAGSGGLLGLAFLARPVGVVVCIGAAVLLVLCRKAREGILFGLIMLGAWGIVTLPWAFRNYVAMGEPTPFASESGSNFFMAVCEGESRECEPLWSAVAQRLGYPRSDPADRALRQLALTRIRAHLASYLAKGPQRVAHMWRYFPGSFATVISARRPLFVGLNIIHFGILITAVLGLTTVEPKWRALLLLPAVSLSLPIFGVSAGSSRYILPAMPYLLLLSFQGAARAAHYAAQWTGGRVTAFERRAEPR